MGKKTNLLKDAIKVYTFIFLIWGFYRLFFRLPEEIEEVVLKPAVWLLPIFWYLAKEKANLASIGWSAKNLFKSLYLGLAFGIFFGVLALATHLAKYQGLSFIQLSFAPTFQLLLFALGISFVTAISEETAFRGFIFTRLYHVLKEEWLANIISSASWALIHIPIAIFVFRYDLSQMTVYLLLSFLFGLGSAFVFARTGTITASVLLHVFWSWPIILFR